MKKLAKKINKLIRLLPSRNAYKPAGFRHPRERGQAIVITAIAFLAILAFMGLVTDSAVLYLNYTRLKRALDAASLAAANNIKDSELKQNNENQWRSFIHDSAREMLMLNNIKDISSMETYVCDDPSRGKAIPADFASFCPTLPATQRKLAWVEATQNSPVYFLQLFGVDSVPLTIHSIGEAAALDVVIVIDVSESMASDTADYTGGGYDATSLCIARDDCQPLNNAKTAANHMVDMFFDNHDQIAVVQYATKAVTIDNDGDGKMLNPDHTEVTNAIDSITLFDGPGYVEIVNRGGGFPQFGEVNPMDIDGDGTYYQDKDIIQSTCTGCGIRTAGRILRAEGRADSVWVIVLLSDGSTNVSDLPPAGPAGGSAPWGGRDSSSPVPNTYSDGFCGGSFGNRLWTNDVAQPWTWCTDQDPATRHCGPFHSNATECPPGSAWVGASSPDYDADDYAYDMTDWVALMRSANASEPVGGDDSAIAIYTIGLGDAADPARNYAGEELLRYMANIGDDNTRNPVPDIVGDDFPADPCDGAAHGTSCGQYYFVTNPTAANLKAVFEDIAENIFTRISQ